jgi:hypothetical protein
MCPISKWVPHVTAANGLAANASRASAPCTQSCGWSTGARSSRVSDGMPSPSSFLQLFDSLRGSIDPRVAQSSPIFGYFWVAAMWMRPAPVDAHGFPLPLGHCSEACSTVPVPRQSCRQQNETLDYHLWLDRHRQVGCKCMRQCSLCLGASKMADILPSLPSSWQQNSTARS